MVPKTTIDSKHRFVSSKELLHSPDSIRGQVLTELKIPAFILDRLCLELNGFSGCRSILGSNGHLEVYSKV